MIDYDRIVTRLRALETRKLMRKFATDSGLPPDTIEKIYYGESTNPRIRTVEALEKALDRQGL